jgi:hypothetical protein
VISPREVCTHGTPAYVLWAPLYILGKVELKLHMPKDKPSKGYNWNKSIPKGSLFLGLL